MEKQKIIKIIGTKSPKWNPAMESIGSACLAPILKASQAKVDLVMETALKPAIGKRILSEVEYV